MTGPRRSQDTHPRLFERLLAKGQPCAHVASVEDKGDRALAG
ncbi:hypothetical protein ACFW5L_14065 [Streptomyces albidoflavus]